MLMVVKYLLGLLTLMLVACGPGPRTLNAPAAPAFGQTVRPAELTIRTSARATNDDTPSTDTKPITRPGEMPPLDRSVLDPAVDRVLTPEARERNHWIMDQLWTTTLGQEYLAYLTDPVPPEQVPARALRLVDRIYGKGQHATKRQKAIEAFTLDLYARDKMSVDILKRSLLVTSASRQKDLDGTDGNANIIIKLTLVGAGAALVLASPSARTELMKLRAIAFNRCRGRACEPFGSIRWANIFNPKKFAEDYKFKRSWGVYAGIAGGAGMLYDQFVTKMPAFRKELELDRELLNGRENLLVELEF